MMNCSIADFGARTTDVLQTEIIQKAIDTCFLAGGGTVRVPKGIYRTGDIRIRSNVTLYLEKGAILEGSQNPEDYMHIHSDQVEPITQEERDRFANVVANSANPYSRWSNSLIRAVHAKNISIIAEEFTWIDGMNCFDFKGEEQYRGPHPIGIHFCENITLKGYSIRRNGNWGHNITNSKNIHVDNVTVLGGSDAFDMRTCDNVLVENCYFDSGDDAIAGFDNNDIVVRNCLLASSCFALRFGGNNVLVENCRAPGGGGYGFRGKLAPDEKRRSFVTGKSASYRTGAAFMYYGDKRAELRKAPGNILIRNCEFEDLEYIFCMKWGEGYLWCDTRPLRQIKFENCVFRSVSDPIYLHGSKKEPMLFEMENCEVTVKPGCENIAFLNGIDMGTVKLTNVQLHGFNNPVIYSHTPGTVLMGNCSPITVRQLYNPDFRGRKIDRDTDSMDGRTFAYDSTK